MTDIFLIELVRRIMVFLTPLVGHAGAVRVLTYTTPSPVLLAGLPFSGPPIAIAIEEVTKQYGLNITNVVIAKKGLVTCDEAVDNTYLVAEFMYRNWDDGQPFFIVNPGCYDEITLGYYAAQWNIPIMTSGTTYPVFYDTTAFPSMVAFAAFDLQQMTDGLLDIFEHFSWTSVAVIHDVSKVNTLYAGVYESLMIRTVRVARYLQIPVDTSSTDPIPYQSVLDQIWPVSRNFRCWYQLFTAPLFYCLVVLLLMMAKPARDFLIAAQKAGRTNGEYAYFCAEPFQGIRRFGNLTWQMGDENDQVAREAFRSVLQLTASCFSAGKHPQQRVMERIKADGIAQYNASYVKDEEASAASLGHYYAMKALGEVLDEAVKEKADLRDGRAMASRFRGRTFVINGAKLVIGPNRVRIQDYCLKDMDPETGVFKAAISYDAWSHQLNPIANRTVDWGTPGNLPPPNEPVCGFTGEKAVCQRSHWNAVHTVEVTVPLAILLILISGTVLRYIYELALAAPWWQLENTIRMKAVKSSRTFALTGTSGHLSSTTVNGHLAVPLLHW